MHKMKNIFEKFQYDVIKNDFKIYYIFAFNEFNLLTTMFIKQVSFYELSEFYLNCFVCLLVKP